MCEDGSIRLSDTTVDSEGRLDLCVDRIWGSVLSDHFNHLDGRVACSQLGYSSDGKSNIRKTFSLILITLFIIMKESSVVVKSSIPFFICRCYCDQ